MFDIKSNKYTVYQTISMVKNGTLELTNAIQRPAGQWNNQAKGLLIDSLLVGYPVPPIYAITTDRFIVKKGRKKPIYSLLDGQQRITTINDYANDRFALNKDLTPIDIDDESFDISGKKFSELPEPVKQNLFAVALTYTFVDDLSNEEIEEMFYRLNSGKPLSAIQRAKAKLGIETIKLLDSLINHPLMQTLPFTKAQIKNSDNLKLVIELFALNTKLGEHSLRMSNLTKVAKLIGQQTAEETNQNVTQFSQAMDELKTAITEKVMLKKHPEALKMSNLPIILTMIIKDHLSTEKVTYLLTKINQIDNQDDSNPITNVYHSNNGALTANQVNKKTSLFNQLLSD